MLLEQLAGSLSFALELLESREAVRFLEYLDPLTSMPKRSLFVKRLAEALERARAGQTRVAVVVLDARGLGTVNDGLGHHAGDVLLRLLAERLKLQFRDADCSAHLGAGVFAVALAVQRESDDGHSWLDEQLRELVAEPFTIADEELHVSLCTGIAQFPSDGENAEELLRCAQTALRQAKDAGGRLMRFASHMNGGASRRFSIETRLRRAVAERRFELHYQPKVLAESGEVEGVEALLRWPQADEELRSPAAFVPLLERLGLVEELGYWIIEQALADCARLSAVHGRRLSVAVNVSMRQLRQADFVERVLTLCERARAGAGTLELELTEGMLMVGVEDVLRKLKALRGAAVRIAIDDFGMGYSSLRRLSALPATTLKIDRSFVTGLPRDRDCRTIVNTVVSLARAFDLSTVAERVESAEQARHLAEEGCELLQGYWLAKPMSNDELCEWLQRRPSRQPVLVRR